MPLLTVLVPADKARALDFSLQTIRAGNCGDSCPKVIVASGEIYIDDDMRLLRLFRATPDLQRVAPLMMINSPGGQAGGGFRLAHVVRTLKITVAVASPIGETGYGPAHCHSACTLVLSGGVRRIVVPGSEVAIHWASEPPPRLDPQTGGYLARGEVSDAELAAEFRRFFRSMGVSTKIVDAMRKIPGSDFRLLAPRELRSLRLATGTKL